MHLFRRVGRTPLTGHRPIARLLPIQEGTTQKSVNIRGPCEKFVDWRKCVAVTQREVVTVMPSCSGGGSVVVA
jgi:hypothetical protein